jgi:hypothetical protein
MQRTNVGARSVRCSAISGCCNRIRFAHWILSRTEDIKMLEVGAVFGIVLRAWD